MDEPLIGFSGSVKSIIPALHQCPFTSSKMRMTGKAKFLCADLEGNFSYTGQKNNIGSFTIVTRTVSIEPCRSVYLYKDNRGGPCFLGAVF